MSSDISLALIVMCRSVDQSLRQDGFLGSESEILVEDDFTLKITSVPAGKQALEYTSYS
jgi:hypothetical protein